MKNKFISFLLSLVMLAAFVPMSASAAEVASGNCGANGDNVTWVLDDAGKLTISGTGAMADYSVVKFATSAPWGAYQTKIKSVVVEAGVTHLGDYSFYRMMNYLRSIKLPDGLISVGDYALYWCANVAPELPDSVTSVGDDACNWYGNASYSIPSDLKIMGVNAFKKSNIENAIIPSGVITVAEGAFSDCKAMTTLEFSEGVTTIETNAFSNCSALNTISLPSTLTSIADAFNNVAMCIMTYNGTMEQFNAISGNENLPKGTVTCTDGVIDRTTISGKCGDNAIFTYKDGRLVISGSGDMYDYTSASTPWYDVKYNITEIDIANTITHIGEYAFSNCTNLTNIDFPEGVESIGYGALFGNNNSIKVTLPNSLKKIGMQILGNFDFGRTAYIYNGTKSELLAIEGGESFALYYANKDAIYFTSAEAEQIDVPNIENAETNKDAQAWYVEEQLNVADSQWSIVVGKDGAEQTITEEIGTTFTNATVQYGVVLYNLGDYEVVSVTLEGGNN